MRVCILVQLIKYNSYLVFIIIFRYTYIYVYFLYSMTFFSNNKLLLYSFILQISTINGNIFFFLKTEVNVQRLQGRSGIVFKMFGSWVNVRWTPLRISVLNQFCVQETVDFLAIFNYLLNIVLERIYFIRTY